MTLIKFYIRHGFRWLIFDRINVILILLSLVVPFLSVLSINNVYASDTVYGLNAIDIQYRWYQKYQGPLDSVSFDTILSDTMVEPLNVSGWIILLSIYPDMRQIKILAITASAALASMGLTLNINYFSEFLFLIYLEYVMVVPLFKTTFHR